MEPGEKHGGVRGAKIENAPCEAVEPHRTRRSSTHLRVGRAALDPPDPRHWNLDSRHCFSPPIQSAPAMKIHPDCRPCLLKQMETTAKAAGADEETLQKVLEGIAVELNRSWNNDLSPPAVSTPLYQFASQMCGVEDPFLAMKVRYTREALKLLPKLEKLVQKSSDPFDTAVRISIAGNIIDFGTGEHGGGFDMEETLVQFLEKPFFQNGVDEMREKVSKARTILYIGDNAGETVFDRPLLGLLGPDRVVYAAKERAIINDATVSDAALAGIHLHARLISTGAGTPGTILEECSALFRDHFERADLMIAKGQGNFETLTELTPDGRIFMLFTVKCPVAADYLGAAMGDMVVMKW